MPGFDSLYRQTVTLFNRVNGDTVLWYPTVLENVHLILDDSSSWDNYGGKNGSNARLHVRYKMSGANILIAQKQYYLPKDWRRLEHPENAITFSLGDNDDFDFFIEGSFNDIVGPVSDDQYDRKGFYNYMNARYDHVFVITSVSKYNLIPHFEIYAR